MPAAALPENEGARLARLRSLAVLDTASEPMFEALAHAASQLTATPIALLSLIDADRQWFKANVGLEGVAQTSRDEAFCAHAIHDDAMMVVHDALQDARFADNPLVTGSPGIRFYAGAPLVMPEGQRVGTLCVIDRQPRQLSPEQRTALAALARVVVEALLLRERAFVAAAAARSRLESELTGNLGTLNSVLDQLPVAISVWDRELRNVYHNATIERWFGRTAASILGRPIADLIGEQMAHDDLPMQREVLAGATRSVERSVPLVTGAIEQRLQLMPYRLGDGSVDGMVALVSNLGELRAAERALRASERQFRSLADSSPLGIYQTDAMGQCLYTNARWQDIYGLTLEQSLGDGWARALHAQDEAEVVRRWREAAAGTGEFEMEFRVQRASGETRYVRSNSRALRGDDGTVEGYVGTVADITARREAELALQERNQQLRLLYEKTPAMLQSIDSHGLLSSVSDVWLMQLGYTREHVVGKPWTDFLNEPSRQHVREHALPLLWRHGRVDRVPCRWLRHDGRAIDALFSAICLEPARGAPQRALAVIEDVTEVLARTAELQREQALRSQIEGHANTLQGLLSERSEMLDVLAHEVRQPLHNASAALQSASALLAEQGQAAASMRLARAQDVIGNVQAGVDNILAGSLLLAVDAAPERADTDLDTLIALVVGDMPAHERGRVSVLRESRTRTAAIDLALTRLGLRNLIANALTHARKLVQLRLADSDAPLGVIIDVIDDGQGVDPLVLPRLFERGARSTRKPPNGRTQGSHGLGLHIARRAIELQGGSVTLLSTGREGTVMRMLLSQTGD